MRMGQARQPRCAATGSVATAGMTCITPKMIFDPRVLREELIGAVEQCAALGLGVGDGSCLPE
jgi:hypothetical protein